MATGQDSASVTPFETIRQINEYGAEFWSARALAKVLGYNDWRNFLNVVSKARLACKNSGQDIADHFGDITNTIATGKGAHREVADINLSRYACYLIVQNADPEKPVVALGQTYFAVQTRRAEIADQLAGMSEDQRRLVMRDEVTEQNKQLAAAAADAGVKTSRDHADFNNRGLYGLYGGLTARDIRLQRGLAANANIYDWMGFEELGDNLFRQIQAEARLRREGVSDKAQANRIHQEVGEQVRRFIVEDLHGTPPEDLPTPAESIQEVKRRERERLERERQPELWSLADPDA